MTHTQQQQATFVQVFTIMFQTYLDKYKELLRQFRVDSRNQALNGEIYNLKFILKSYLWLFNALPDEAKSNLYDCNKQLIDELHID